MNEIEGEKIEPGAVVVGRFRLERVLGEGGMGIVWAAEEIASGRRVALKFLRDGETADSRSVERFLREARAAMAISHPNVAKVEAALETRAGAPFLVMELLAGKSLRELLLRRRTLGLPECSRVVVAVVDAVAAAHDQRIVHRDLKPENVFMVDGGDIRVLDFGIAKQLPRDAAASAQQSLTTTGTLLGTPLYMAPEQLFGDDVDIRADVWALGVMIYECLAGEAPTAGNGFGPVIKRITTEPLVPLEHVRGGLPLSVTSIVARMLSRDRAQRPPLAEIRHVFATATASTDAPPSPLAMSYSGGAPSDAPPYPRPAMLAPPRSLGGGGPSPYATTAGAAVHTPPPAKKGSGAIVGGILAGVLVAGAAAVVALTRLKTDASPDAGVAGLAAPSTLGGHLTDAANAMGRRDGRACLAALDAADRLSPPGQPRSTDATSGQALQRSICTMLAGDCDRGKAQNVAYFEANNAQASSHDAIVAMAEGAAAQYCEGDSLAPRDALLRASFQLQQIAAAGRPATVADCRRLHDAEKRLVGQVPPRNPQDQVVFIGVGMESQFAVCLAHAGACAEAFATYRADWLPHHQDYAPADREPSVRIAFDNAVTTTTCRARL